MIEVFLDVETKSAFSSEVRDPAGLGVSFVGIYQRGGEKDGFGSFFEEDFTKLWPILESADLIIGYNSNKFDLPALNPLYPGNLLDLPSFDLLEVIKDSLGRRIRLDNIARATLGVGKIGSGFDAINYWRDGELDKLAKYCLKDVEVTRDVYDFGQKERFLKYIEPPNEIRQFNLQWPEIKKAAATSLTLGI